MTRKFLVINNFKLSRGAVAQPGCRDCRICKHTLIVEAAAAPLVVAAAAATVTLVVAVTAALRTPGRRRLLITLL